MYIEDMVAKLVDAVEEGYEGVVMYIEDMVAKLVEAVEEGIVND